MKITTQVSLLAAAALVGSAAVPSFAAMKMSHPKKVVMYQAAICHMYFTPAQAKKYAYACPDSKGTMHKVMVSPATARAGEAKTNKILMSMKKKS